MQHRYICTYTHTCNSDCIVTSLGSELNCSFEYLACLQLFKPRDLKVMQHDFGYEIKHIQNPEVHIPNFPCVEVDLIESRRLIVIWDNHCHLGQVRCATRGSEPQNLRSQEVPMDFGSLFSGLTGSGRWNLQVFSGPPKNLDSV